MESDDNIEIDVCDENFGESQDLEKKDAINGDRNVIVDIESCYLSASELFMLRRDVRKSKDEDMEIHKGPKIYTPTESKFENEVVENALDNLKKSLKLPRGAKIRDCVKAEWDEELKIVIVPYLKGKSTQHMGHNLNGKIALSPEESLFLLEKNCIEIIHKNMPMSVEEAYTVLLKGKLGLEKYQVYSHLSQQGFIVVQHQSRYEEFINLNKAKLKKRKAADEATEVPPEKRLTFTGILTPSIDSNISFNTDGCISLSSSKENMDCSDSTNKNNTLPDLTSNNIAVNITCDLPSNHDSLEFDSGHNKIVVPDSTEQSKSLCFAEDLSQTTSEEANDNELMTMKDVSMSLVQNSIIIDNSDIKVSENISKSDNRQASVDFAKISEYVLEPKCKQQNVNLNVSISKNMDKHRHSYPDNKILDLNAHEIIIKKSDTEKETDKIPVEISKDRISNEFEVEKANDANDVILDDEDINVDESFSSDFNNCEYSSNGSEPVVCEENSDVESLDVLSCSTSGHQSRFDHLSSQSDNLLGIASKDIDDDEITLIEVKKKEIKPLAVIDLLSDEEQDIYNDDKKFDGSDDDIQVVKVCHRTKSAHVNSKSSPALKLEYKKERSGLLKCGRDTKSFHPQMVFPDMFRKDVLCLPRPPANLLPNHVRPAKEAYVINRKNSFQSKGRVWNSYKDMQEYQRQRRRDRQFNTRPPSLRDYRFKNNSEFYSTRNNGPFNRQENSREFNFDRNNQNFVYEHDSHPNRNSPFRPEISRDITFDRNNQRFFEHNVNSFNSALPMDNQEQNSALLPNPVFPQIQVMNMNNLHNLSASNPTAFVNEIQKTVFSVATTMLSTMLGQQLNPMNRSSPTFNEMPAMGCSSHNQFNNFGNSSPLVPDHMAFNTNIRTDFHPLRFPSEPSFSGERFPYISNRVLTFDNSWRPSFQQRNFDRRGHLFPCPYREVQKKRCWNDVKAAVEKTTANMSDSGSDIEEIPINLNQFLWSNDIHPLVKPGTKLPISEVLKKLQITQMANLRDEKRNIDIFVPEQHTLEISYDVYLPGSKYKKTAPDIPKHRIIVLRSSDPIPKYSEVVFLQRKWNDQASLQLAVVDHGDVSFFSFSSINLPSIEPHNS